MKKSSFRDNKSSIFYTVKSFTDSNRFLNPSTSSNRWVNPTKIRRTSSQYHSQCISGSKLADLPTPKPIKEKYKIRPNREIKANKAYGSGDISTFTKVSKEISPHKCVIPQKISPPENKNKNTLNSDNNQETQPVNNKKEIIELSKSTLLNDIKNLFPEVSMDGIEEPDLCGELTLTFTTSSQSKQVNIQGTKTFYNHENEHLKTQENKAINTQENTTTTKLDSPFIKFINKSSIKLNSLLKQEEFIFDQNYSLSTRLIQLCNQIYCQLTTIKSLEDIDNIIKIFVYMNSLKELIQCWLYSSPRQTIHIFEDHYVKLYNNISKVIESFKKTESLESRKQSSEQSLSNLVFLIGKRLLEVNASLDDSIWHNTHEFMMNNLVKACTTQFHISLQSIVSKLTNSGREVSSLYYECFMAKKAEQLISLLELSNEFLENLQLAMKKFALWYQHCNAESNQCYKLHYLWHSENYRFLSNISSILKKFTICISRSVTEPGNISDIVQVYKLLQSIESEIEKIQKSLPFSSKEINDHDFDLKELETSFKTSLLVIGRIKHLISTSFSYKSILKKISDYNLI